MKKDSRTNRIKKTRDLKQDAELEMQILQEGPMDGALLQSRTLDLARRYHDLLWEGVPTEFNNFANWNYLNFKSLRSFTIETLKSCYPNNTIECVLKDIIGGLTELVQCYHKQSKISPIRMTRNTIKLFRMRSQAFFKRNPNFLTIVLVIIGILSLAAVLFFSLPLGSHK